jgi:flagellar basal body-associated protein FliL
MSAYVEHEFKKAYLLDEERLRKVNSILTNRSPTVPDTSAHMYKVFRSDSYSYATDSVDMILKEDNPEWAKIEKLEVSSSKIEKFRLLLVFGKDGTKLEIEGEDRDQVFLLFSDIKEYLNAEVNTRWKASERIISLSLMVLTLFALTIVFYFTTSKGYDEEGAKSAMQSTDIASKLNFIIQNQLQKDHSSSIGLVFPLLMLVMLATLTRVPRRIFCYFYPQNQFLIGKQKVIIEKRREFFSKVFWIIIIGLIVTVIGGILVWYFTSVRK